MAAHDGETWQPLAHTYRITATLLGYDPDDPPLATLRRARLGCQERELTETRRHGKHFETRLTPRGVEYLAGETTSEPEVVIELPLRMGRGHLLNKTTFRALMASVRAGDADLVAVRRDQLQKVRYWDE